MLTYNFENAQGPIYLYLYKCIKDDILSGALKPGERLPSKRSFAENNGISIITIQNAYDQLISEGYVYTLPKKGYYVSNIQGVTVSPTVQAVDFDIAVPKIRTYRCDFSGNGMDADSFPFSVWSKMLRDVLSEKKEELMTISPAAGVYELRVAIAKHLQSFRGMSVDPNQIVIGAGTEYLYGLITELLGRDKVYAIEEPGYHKLYNIYHKQNIECRFMNIDDYGVNASELTRSGAEVAHICPNHHFPTGITMPASRRYEVLSWANEDSGRYIVEDDYDSEFRVEGKPIPTLFSIDAYRKVIYMNTFSKSLTPTIRISYMVLPVHLAQTFQEKMSLYSCTVSNFEQYTLAKFIDGGYFEKHINRMRLFYSRKRRNIIRIIRESKLASHCEIQENVAGLHFLLRLKTTLSDEAVMTALNEKDIKIQAVSDYYFEKTDRVQHLFIINYSNLDELAFQDAVEVVYNIIVGQTNKN